MVGEAPFGDDRTATGDDPGDPVGGPGDEGEADAGMYGEVVDALFGLLDQRIPVDLPGQLLDDPAHLLEGLVDRDGRDRDGGVPDGPLAGPVDFQVGYEEHLMCVAHVVVLTGSRLTLCTLACHIYNR